MKMPLKDKNILVGVTGGIAAYKTVRVVRRLIKRRAQVRVIMTRSACHFVQPLTFEVLSQNPVYTELFPTTREYNVLHVSLADWADLFLIAPATGNIIGKISGGIADDLLSTVVMACPAPKLLAPAMETHMLENPIVCGNIEKLRSLGYHFIEPGEGLLASGATGRGRMAEPEDIVRAVEEHLKGGRWWVSLRCKVERNSGGWFQCPHCGYQGDRDYVATQAFARKVLYGGFSTPNTKGISYMLKPAARLLRQSGRHVEKLAKVLNGWKYSCYLRPLRL